MRTNPFLSRALCTLWALPPLFPLCSCSPHVWSMLLIGCLCGDRRVLCIFARNHAPDLLVFGTGEAMRRERESERGELEEFPRPVRLAIRDATQFCLVWSIFFVFDAGDRGCSTMAEYTVISEISAAKISDDADLEKVQMRTYVSCRCCLVLIFGVTEWRWHKPMLRTIDAVLTLDGVALTRGPRVSASLVATSAYEGVPVYVYTADTLPVTSLPTIQLQLITVCLLCGWSRPMYFAVLLYTCATIHDVPVAQLVVRCCCSPLSVFRRGT